MRYWIATCSKCGNVKIAHHSKPTSCKEQVSMRENSTSVCNYELTDVFDDVSPAMRVRHTQNRCPEFDTLHSHIYLFTDPKTDRYVTISLPLALYPLGVLNPEHSLHCAFYRAVDEQAASRWLAKYGEEVPSSDDLECGVPETMMASDQQYPGPSLLTLSESKVLEDSHVFGQVTLDIVFLIVEVLGWRPGQPVPEDDPGWITLWAEEEIVLGTMAVARHVLGMPYVEDGWMPAAVVELYAKERVQWAE